MSAEAFKSLTRRLIFILIAISLITDTTSSCAKGCLKCNTSSKICQICDFYSGFSLKSGACEQLDIKDCKVINPIVEQTECLQCNDEMSFDKNSNECVTIPGDNIITGCKVYSNTQACLECEDKFYMNSLICSPVDNEIKGCLKYSSKTLCSVCSGNSKLNVVSGNCDSFEGQSNCQSHSFTKCDSCDKNYVLDPNQHFTLDILDAQGNANQSVISHLFDDVLHQGKYKEKRESPFTLCQPLEYVNCATYTKTNDIIKGCATCLFGFLLNSNTNSCDPFPNAPIINCETYENSTTCAKCTNKFFTVDGKTCDSSADILSCSIYFSDKEGCKECKSTHYVNSSFNCTPRSANNCDELDINHNKCKCEDNQRLTDDGLRCLAKISDCNAYEPSSKTTSKLICQTCNSTKYYPDNNSCLKQESDNCTDYEDYTNNCTVCTNNTYYLDTSTTSHICVAKTVTFCKEFSSDNLNHCKDCENLYVLDKDNTCSQMTIKTDCAKNTQNTDKCEECKTPKKLFTSDDASTTCIANDNTMDTKCSNIGENAICEACDSGFLPFKLNFLYETVTDKPKCEKFDKNGDCYQCKADMESSDASTCISVINAADTNNCKQLKESIFTLLNVNGSCAVCVNSTTHYIPTGTCIERSSYTKLNCNTLNVIEDKCSECNDTFIMTKIPSTSNTCIDTSANFNQISNCRVYNYFDRTKCLECDPTKTPGSGNIECIADTDRKLPTYIFKSDDLQIIKKHSTTEVSNCNAYDLRTLTCIECNAGFVLRSAINSNSIITSASEELIYGPQIFELTSCVNISSTNNKWAQESNNTTKTEDNCFVSALDEDTNFCLSCKKGFIGNVFTASNAFSIDGNQYNGSKISNAFMNCEKASDLTISITRTMKNSYYRDLNNINNSKKFDHEVFDTCGGVASNNIVYFLDKANLTLKQEGTLVSKRKYVECINLTNPITNCQVHIIESDNTRTDSNNLNSTSQTNLDCLACKPGYYYHSGSCTKISNCDDTVLNKNTWMGSCETCKDITGWEYEVQTSTKIINISKCITSIKNNCLVLETNDCIICKPNFVLNTLNNTCVSYPTICSENGMPDHKFEQSNNILNNELAKMFLLFNFKTEFEKGPNICATCSGSKKLFRAEEAEKNRIVCEKETLNDVNILDGCKLYSDIGTCHECDATYIINTSDNKCKKRTGINSSLISHCSEFDGIKCTKCSQQHYMLNVSNICTNDHHCVEHEDFKTCLTCELNFKPDSIIASKCIPVLDTDPCSQYAKNNLCVNCKNTNHMPIRKLDSDDNKITYCVEKRNNYDPNMIFTYKTNNNSAQTIIYKNSYKYNKKEIALSSTTKLIPEYICVKGPTDSNCTTFNPKNFYECDTCNDGYYPNDMKRCVTGEIVGCLKYTSAEECTKCNHERVGISNDTYYLKAGTCKPHSAAKNHCEVHSDSDDKCNTCKNHYNIDSNKVCQPNTILKKDNCAKSLENEDNCDVCNDGAYIMSNECKTYTVSNCEIYNKRENKCTSCNSGFYLRNPENTCDQNTAKNCESKSKATNSCLTCPVKHYKHNNDCAEHINITNCEIYSKESDICTTCESSHYVFNKLCKIKPNGIKHCVVYSDFENCTQCAKNYYLDGNMCKKASSDIAKCKIYKSATECDTCASDTIKSVNETACNDPTNKTCHTWDDTDSCATCTENEVLETGTDGNKNCVASGLNHCAKITLKEAVASCGVCEPRYILKDGECSSPKVRIADCEIYNNDDESCESCSDGSVLSFKKDECKQAISTAGDHCLKAHIVSDTLPSCILCEFGYRMNLDGVCETCGGEGCTLCNSLDNDKCELCSPGYFMDDNSACSLNDPVVDLKSVRVITMAVMFALVSLFLKNE